MPFLLLSACLLLLVLLCPPDIKIQPPLPLTVLQIPPTSTELLGLWYWIRRADLPGLGSYCILCLSSSRDCDHYTAYTLPPGEVCWAVNINNNLHTQTHEFYTLPPSSLFFERASFWSPRNRSCWNFSLALQSSRALSEAS